MNVDSEKEWTDLAEKARRAIDNPLLLPVDQATKHFSAVLHLWVQPTFTPERHFVFYEPNRNLNPLPKPILRKVEWNRESDLARVRNGELDFGPTFSYRTAEIEWEELRRVTKRLATISFPPFEDADISGRDGDNFGVQNFGLFQSARVVWWSEFGESWSGIARWHAETMEFIGLKLTASGLS